MSEHAIVPKSDLPVEQINSWDRQQGESSEVHAWFIEYLKLGPMRSVYKLTTYDRTPYEVKEKRDLKQLRKWRNKWKWDERAIDYDDYVSARILDKQQGNLLMLQQAARSEEMQWAQKLSAVADKISEYVLEGNLPVKQTVRNTTVTEIDGEAVGRTTTTTTTDYQALVNGLPKMIMAVSDLMRRSLEMTKEKTEVTVNSELAAEDMNLESLSLDELQQLQKTISAAVKKPIN